MAIKQSSYVFFTIMGVLLLNACTTQNKAPVHQINEDSRYAHIERGSYTGDLYKVKKGETLFFISYITDKNISDIAKYNYLQKPYTIYPGQVLRLTPAQLQGSSQLNASSQVITSSTGASQVIAAPTSVNTTPQIYPVTTPVVKQKAEPIKSLTSSQTPPVYKKEVVEKASSVSQDKVSRPQVTVKKPVVVKKVESVKKVMPPKVVKTTPKKVTSSTSSSSYVKVRDWQWPTKGKILQRFSATTGNKGVNIGGKKGQAIYAAAAGKVVYAGNALRGYGNIIIIKHNSDYLSAYAHNDVLLVKENQNVTAGQKIALMGKSSSPIVQLHFEIRYKGKSVDPLRYLP